ncbi:hypothetical protein SDC9_146700 [bioreactor metagenome]|uniref:Uncharacterized protein n=1 Tax=bioreactor metagenome TaxID=1076179 RepID=A0A645EEF6_9ZZZZ
MNASQLHQAEGDLHARLFGHGKALRDARVVGQHAQKSRHQGLVGAVAGAGGREGAVELQACRNRLAAQHAPGNQPDSYRARRVGAGGADHDRPHDVKDVQRSSPPLPIRMPPGGYSILASGLHLEWTIICAL